jgi:hypothetical protein
MDFVRSLFSAGSAPAQTGVAPNVEENPARYCPGDYHPVAIGDVYQGRYQVMAKLGFGGYSTVWLAQGSWSVLLLVNPYSSRVEGICSNLARKVIISMSY